MHHVRLVCGACGGEHAPDMKTLECGGCGGPLDAEYEGQGGSLDVAGYEAAMPFSDMGSMPTLGEGNTPVVGLAELGGALGLERLDAKLEYMNPTGSYKDRGTVVMLAVAREQGVRKVAEDSSGNAGGVGVGVLGPGRNQGAHLRPGDRAGGQAEADQGLRRGGALHRGAPRGGYRSGDVVLQGE